MKDIKTNFIRNNSLLYIFTAVVVSVIIIFSIKSIYAEENDKKPLDLWENNSLLSKDEDKKKELNSVSTKDIINSEEEMQEMKEECQDDWGFRECFTLAYPLSYTMPDGSTLSASDEEDLATKMEAFFESYDGEKKKPELVFPADITFEDGSVLTVNSHEEMKQAWKDNCRRKGGEEDEGESDGTRG